MRRRLIIGATIALAVFASLTGFAVSQAFWSSSATVKGTIASGTVKLQASGLVSQTFLTNSLQTPVLVTLTNTGSLTLSGFTATSSASGNATAADINLTIWDNGSSTTCATTPPAGAVTNTWASLPSGWLSTVNSNGLAPNTSEQFCFASQWNGSSADYGQTVTPTITVSAAYKTSTTWTASGPQSAPLVVPQPSVVNTSQVAVTATSGASASVDSSNGGLIYNQSNPQTDIEPSSNTDPGNGTIDNSSSYCVQLLITGSTSMPTAWSVTIDSSKPPYDGMAPGTSVNGTQVAEFNGVETGVFTKVGSGPQYLLKGSGSVNAQGTNFGTINTSSAPNIDNDNLIKTGQSVTVTYCLQNIGDNGSGTAAPLYAQGNSTYAVTTGPQLTSCSHPGTTDWTGVGDVCIYTQLSGYYPHFYIGYQYTYNWANLVTAAFSGTSNAGWVNTLKAEHFCGSNFSQTYTHTNGLGSGSAAAPSVTPTTSTNGNYTVTSQGVGDASGGITNFMTVTNLGYPVSAKQNC